MKKPLSIKRLDKLRSILIQEMMDGCLDCSNGGLCSKHLDEAQQLFINPKKVLDLNNKGIPQTGVKHGV